MRRSHMVPSSIRASNLARWFPLGLFPGINGTVSGVSTDALLFSHVGAQLMHMYRVFARSGTHAISDAEIPGCLFSSH